jgi:hypothetical protein
LHETIIAIGTPRGCVLQSEPRVAKALFFAVGVTSAWGGTGD